MIRRIFAAIYGGFFGVLAGGFVGILVGSFIDKAAQSNHEFYILNDELILACVKVGAVLGSVFFAAFWGYHKGPPPD